MKRLAVLIFIFSLVRGADEEGEKDPILSYKLLPKPFRKHTLNELWNKARVRLSEAKLKLLHFELKAQDKDEMALKKLKAEFGDKDGLREAEVRAQLSQILNHYGFVTGLVEVSETDKRIFKDKRMESLWEKAKVTGMHDEELMLLKKEFQHYQDKVDEYKRIVEITGRDPMDRKRQSNVVDYDDDEVDVEAGKRKHANHLDDRAMKLELKRNYEKLHRMATNGFPKPFGYSKVSGLWKLAQEGQFTADELEDLRQELEHFEHRLEKLHLIQGELQLIEERGHGDVDDKTDVRKKMDLKLKKQAEIVKDVQWDLERKILARHSEF